MRIDVQLDADREITEGRMTLKPQNQNDSASAQKLVPADKRVLMVGYWQDGKLVIERAKAAAPAVPLPAETNEKAKLMAMPAAEFETLCVEKGVKYNAKASREAMVDAFLKSIAAKP